MYLIREWVNAIREAQDDTSITFRPVPQSLFYSSFEESVGGRKWLASLAHDMRYEFGLNSVHHNTNEMDELI